MENTTASNQVNLGSVSPRFSEELYFQLTTPSEIDDSQYEEPTKIYETRPHSTIPR